MNARRRASQQVGGQQVGGQRVGGQQGAALMLVLIVLFVTTMVVSALLGYSMVSMRLTLARAQVAAEQRAADGALEAGLGRLTRSVAPNPCSDVPDSDVDFPAETGAGTPAVRVQLSCDPLPLPPDPSAPPSPDPLGGAAVEITGDDYDGAIAVPGGGVGSPTLVATGLDPLRFESDVTVRRGASVDSTAPAGDVPAVRATGQYVQGLAGPGATPSNACGTTSPGGGQIDRSVSDRDQSPECDSAAARALPVREGSIFSPGDSISERSVPPCGSDPTTIVFDAGRYDAVDTAAINNLMDGSCPDHTFWFRPGKYSFDVSDAGAAAADRHALVIDDPTAKIVFGAADGWDAASGAGADSFPRACDAGEAGASLQLSARTTLRHRAGRVSVCPAWNATDEPLPAIVQSSTAPSQPVLVSDNLPANRVIGPVSTRCGILYCSTAQRTRTFQTQWAATGTAPLDNALLLIESSESPPVHQARRNISARVQSGAIDCSTGSLPSGRTNGQYTVIDLLAHGTCATALAGRTAAVFEAATVTVSHIVVDPDGGSLIGRCAAGCSISWTIGDVALRLNATTSRGANATSSLWRNAANLLSRDATNVSDVSQPHSCIVSDERCRDDLPDTERSFTINGFDPVAAAGRPATDHVESLAVQFDSRSTGNSWASLPVDETWVRIDLNLAGGVGPACSVRHDGYHRSMRTTMVDLFEEGGTCRAAVATFGDLVGSSITVTFRSDCMWFNSTRAPVNPFTGRCNQVTLPEWDQVALQVTSDSVPPAPVAQITIDASAGAQGSSFNVFGDTLLALMDIDLHWRGAVTDLPIFGGTTAVHALGSQQHDGAAMGVVCCTPPAVTTLRLQAAVDNALAAEAFVYVGPPGSGGRPPDVATIRRAVSILDWRFCGGGGCADPGSAVVLGTQVTAPPTTAPPTTSGP